MKCIMLIATLSLMLFNVGATAINNEIEVDFKTDYDNMAIMESKCNEDGDYTIEFISINGYKSTVTYNKIDGERIEIPTDTIEIKVYSN